MPTEVASSWEDLQDRLFADSWDPKIKRHRSRHAFRGVACESFALETGLMRLGGDFASLEKHLLRNFRKYAHQSIFENNSLWHWLSLAQHHGLPTRLLDWTYSPFVALHFATCNLERFGEDAAIWKINFAASHKLLPRKIRRPLEDEGADIFTVELLSEHLPDLATLDALSTKKADYLIFFEPPSLDDRIVNQFAYFSVLSRPDLTLEEWMQAHPEVWKKIIVPARLKWEIRDKLDQSNITERVLFPGLDGLSAWLKRHYSPR